MQGETARGERGWRMAALCALLVVLALVSLGIGPVRLPPKAVIEALLGKGPETHQLIVQQIRLPRLLLALTIGGFLGLSGAALQGLLRNPLAEPSLFGAPQSAAFFAVLTLSLGITHALSWLLPILAIFGAFISVVMLLALAGRGSNLIVLILAGLALSSLAGAGTALALSLAPNPFAALEIMFWLMGSLEDRSLQHVFLSLPFMIIGAMVLFAQAPALRALSLGDETAQSLGVNIGRARLLVISGVATGIGAGVAVAGAIGFIGLIAPHLMRAFYGPDPGRLLLPASLAGAALLLGADLAVRLIPATSEIKLGVLTALIGVPFFLVLILHHRRPGGPLIGMG
jgi:iron complex transport system permease protein